YVPAVKPLPSQNFQNQKLVSADRTHSRF
ncbi:hypothetical protein AALP_AAs55418U000100, partial [Arabis alpina]